MKRVVPFFCLLILATIACGQGRQTSSTTATSTSVSQPIAATNTPAFIGNNTPVPPGNNTPVPPTLPPIESPTDQAIPTAVTSFDPVPAEYQELYTELETSLNEFHATLDQQWDGSKGDTAFSAELMIASGNIGEGLLRPGQMGLVRTYLDALQGMGLSAATVQISYPLLVPNFPRSAEYLDFYKQVAAEIKGRGLVFMVETSPIFADTQYSSVDANYASLTNATYFDERQQQVLTIATEIKPDYLSISHEPSTEILLTGLRLSQDEFVSFVQETVDAVHAAAPGVLIGAGNGTWEEIEYIDRYIAETSVDFINLHIYPVHLPGKNLLQLGLDISLKAKAAGKNMMIGESWLYKASFEDMSGPQNMNAVGEIYDRDFYSFWQPLDISFIEALSKLGFYQDFELVSFFWSRYFFAYLDYADTPVLAGSARLNQLSNRASFDELEKGNYTETARAYQRIIQK